ncbi:acyl carrier protein [Streptomyces profundus]|uniref:acyl carrier protein n=1 Tax=Streptomyces profundus TaxID=2867410 RepID=UPI001D16318F|nr:acyl carrier protein [Streptomyces sp. MA3_2.13]UED85082.1 acyl carrier protein [Streptomyces sp. MA3_2.13]
MNAAKTVDKAELRALVAQVLDLDEEVITDEAHFIEDLGVDSLLALELAVAMEREYEIKIESTEIAQVTSLRDIIGLLGQKTAAAPAAEG